MLGVRKMLIIAHSLKDIHFAQLMDVYVQSNSEGKTNILDAEQDFYTYLRDSFFREKGAFIAVWEIDGIYKAALRMEPYKNGLILAGLETAPEERRKGYAALLINGVLQWLAERERVTVYSHVHKGNLASIAVHQFCGFNKILDYAVYIDGSVLRDSITLSYEVYKK